MAFYDDPYFLGALSVIIGGILLFFHQRNIHEEQIAAVQSKTSANGGTKGSNLFDIVPYALNQMEQIGIEQRKVALDLGLKEEQVPLLLDPLKKRRDWLKTAHDHQDIVIPLYNFGGNILKNVLKQIGGG